MRYRAIAGLLLVLVAVALLSLGCGGEESSVERGEAIFDKYCAECHSLTVDGPAKGGPNLVAIFTYEWALLPDGNVNTPQNVKILISTGYGEMPGTALEPDKMKDLIDYLMEATSE